MDKRNWIALSVWSLLLAAIARWPCIPFVNAATLDPNFGLHALSAASFSGNHPFRLESLGYPDGIPAQFIAIPTLLLAKLLSSFWNAVAATHFAVWLWLALQGIGSAMLFPEQPRRNLYLIATAAILNPVHMVALGNGQWENVAVWPILLTATTLKKQHWIGFAFGLVLCAACSPYILLAGLLCTIPFLKPHIAKWPLYTSVALVSALCLAYYNGAEHSQSAHIGPAPASIEEPAQLSGLIFPINHAEDGGIPLNGPLARLQQITELPRQKVYHSDWPWLQATAGSYLGLALIGLAIAGWKRTKNKWLPIGIISSIGLSLGSAFSIMGFQIPLPWALASLTPLSNMAATYRFLAATTALLILCMTHIKVTRLLAVGGIAVLMMDALLISPAHWPLRALEGQPPEDIEHSGPIAFWPAAPLIAPHSIIMTALVFEQPLALFEDPSAEMPTATGQVSAHSHRFNQFSESPDEWRERLLTNNIDTLIQFQNMIGERAHPFHAHHKTCGPQFCVISLEKSENP